MKNVLSLKYKEELDSALLPLNSMGGLNYFVCYLEFNNGEKIILSNLYHMLDEFYGEKLYLEDYSTDINNFNNDNFYLCDANKSVGSKLKYFLEHQHSVYRNFYIRRNSPECNLIFGAVQNKPQENISEFYKTYINNFQIFCVEFLEKMNRVIKESVPNYSHSLLLNDRQYRKKIITYPYKNFTNPLSNKEYECLVWAAQGKSAEETAIILNISPQTVETHRKNIRLKLNCTNMAHCVYEAVKMGILGCLYGNVSQ